jgi:hypothetical protein
LWVSTYFFKTLSSVFNLELSSGVLSIVALGIDSVGVEVPDRSMEGAREDSAVEDMWRNTGEMAPTIVNSVVSSAKLVRQRSDEFQQYPIRARQARWQCVYAKEIARRCIQRGWGFDEVVNEERLL